MCNPKPTGDWKAKTGSPKQEDVWMQTGPLSQDDTSAATLEFEDLVERHYRPLCRFPLSLTHSEADAGDLTRFPHY